MGGFWNISPIKELMTFSIWSSVGLLSDFWITLPSESSVSVLSPHFTVKENFLFLKRSGFKDYMAIFKCITFEGFLAIK